MRRIGDDKLIPVDVRVIVATNKDIAQLVRERSFREDLYYRLERAAAAPAAAAGAPRRYPSACQRVLPRDGVFTAEAFAV
ncbi:MAG: sigma 54-interacting transcriptional regulator [Oscillibacter sp.]